MEEFTPVFVVAIIFGLVAFVIKTISDNRIRRQIIEKGQVDENLKYLYFQQGKNKLEPLSAVKWGLVLIGVGLAFLLGKIFPYSISDEITFGLMFLFAGIAFIIYYFLLQRRTSEESEV